MTEVLGIAFAVVALIAMVLGIRMGGLKSKLTTAETAQKLAEDGLHTLKNEVTEARLRHEKEIEDRDQEIESLYGELESCGDDATRGRVATRGILGLLSPKKKSSNSGGEPGLPQ